VWEPEKTCSDGDLANADPNAEFSRQRYLRDIIKKAGGSSDHYRLVRKLMKHFEETHLDVEKFMRGGDLRGTGRLRRRDFKQALRNAGVTLSDAEYQQLNAVFDADNSGDIDYVEVCRFFDMRAWNEDDELLPWHGRTERLKHADACHEIEEEQASILKRPM
jgi:hypothetical protein